MSAVQGAGRISSVTVYSCAPRALRNMLSERRSKSAGCLGVSKPKFQSCSSPLTTQARDVLLSSSIITLEMSNFPPGYLENTPVRPAPEGQESNFIDPVSRAYQLEIEIAVAVALVVFFLSFRLYCRLRVTKTFGADDCEYKLYQQCL